MLERASGGGMSAPLAGLGASLLELARDVLIGQHGGRGEMPSSRQSLLS